MVKLEGYYGSSFIFTSDLGLSSCANVTLPLKITLTENRQYSDDVVICKYSQSWLNFHYLPYSVPRISIFLG